MALIFADSFQHLATADLLTKYTSKVGAPVISAAAGRRGTGGLLCPDNNYVATSLSKTLPSSQATLCLGFSFKPSSVSYNATKSIASFTDSATPQCSLVMNADGTLSVTRGTGAATVLGTTTYTMSAGTTYYIEWKVTFHDTTGTAEIRVNGASVLSLTSIDTKGTANASANGFMIGMDGGATNYQTFTYSDLYVTDTIGSANTTFLGDVRVDAYFPNGNGNQSDFVGSDSNSTDNYLLVDDATPNSDTDYVESSTATAIDSYAITNMSYTPSVIYGVQTNITAKKDDAGARSIARLIRQGGTNYVGSDAAIATSYAVYSQIDEVDPNTSSAWSKAGVDTAEFGVKVTV